MKKVMISAMLLAGVVFSASAQNNYNPRFPQCPDVTGEGTETIQFTGVVVGLGGQGPNNIVDVELEGNLRVKVVCKKTRGNSVMFEDGKEFFKPFKSPRQPKEIFQTEVNGGGLNFRHATDPLTFSIDEAREYCPGKGNQNWTIDSYVVFLSKWKLNTYSLKYGDATVLGTVSGEPCPNYDAHMQY